MDSREYISLNGKLVTLRDCAAEIAGLVQVNYTYRILHTVGHSPLHLETQIGLLEHSYNALFSREASFDREAIVKHIHGLLYRNNAPSGSNLVKVIAAPNNLTGETDIWIIYDGPLIYPGYNIWHKPAAATALTYEIPFAAFKTSANHICHNYARQYVAGQGYDEVISVNYKGEAVSLGENPLFAIAGKNVYVADAEGSSPQCVERFLGIEICEAAGLAVNETCLPAASLTDVDELFSFNPQGLLPIGKLGNRLFPSTMAKYLGSLLAGLTSKEFL